MSGIAVLIVALILLIAAIYNLFPMFANVARRVYRAKNKTLV
jgi:hypothetical protein